MKLNLKKLQKEYDDLCRQVSSPEALKDRNRYAQLTKRISYLEKIIKLEQNRESYLEEKENLTNAAADSEGDSELKALAEEELKEIEEKIKLATEEIENKIFEENQPQRDAIIEIRAAAGGEESALFCASLFKMYSKYAESRGWNTEILSQSPTEIGGLKEVVFSVRGEGVFSRLKFESGVHRVQRVPTTESGGRIHTSTATVAVLIEPKEVDLKINPEDLRIDTFRSSGAGGQHVNVTDSAVRITHLPTGVTVSCQDERSQIKNRAKALRVVKARIMEKMAADENDKITQARRVQVGTGDRSEKVRTYNFPERRVTDHRINLTIYRLEEVLEGDLEEIIKTLIRVERQKMYETKGLA